VTCVHSRGLKSAVRTDDTIPMGQDKTSVIDATTTTVQTTTPPSVRRNRRLAVAGAVLAVAAGAIAWITVGTDPASADREVTGKGTASASASSPSAAAPSLSAVPTSADPSATAPSAGTAPPAKTGSGNTSAPAPPPAGWEPRTFQGVTFAVPPGAQAADVLDPGNADAPASFVWTGPSVGEGINAQITVWIYTADQAPTLGAEFQPIAVRGADQAHMRTGATGSEPPLTAADVHILSGGRYINVVGMFAAGPAGEQMVHDLVASLSIG
jgi:hypothetical protein